MAEIFRTRDSVIFFKGDVMTVSVTPAMAAQGWPGAQGVAWVDSSAKDEFLVGYSDGGFGGFLLWGSDETSDQFTSMTGNQPHYGFAVLGFGGWVISTSTYERYTWASRNAGPLVPLEYSAQDTLYFSLRGYFTKELEWDLASDPRAPNREVGSVVQSPSAKNNGYLTVQTLF